MLFYCKAGTFEVNNLKNAFENAQATGKDKVTKSTLELKEKESLITSASFRNGITPLGECFFCNFSLSSPEFKSLQSYVLIVLNTKKC